MKKILRATGLVAVSVALAVSIAACGSSETKQSAGDEIIQSIVTGDYDAFENPAGQVSDYNTLDDYINASFSDTGIKANTKEALALLSSLAYQNTHNVEDNSPIVEDAVGFLSQTYPDYLVTDRNVEITLYHAYCLMNAYENDKSNQRYTLGTVVAHAIQDYYVGDESKDDAQAFIDQMGTQFFDNLDAKPNTANVEP